MVNSKFDAGNHYFSGQGVVMIGQRDPVTGLPTGLRALGNCSDLKITIATTVIDHKGSQDGQRAIDSRLQTETKATASVTLESWIAANLAKALRGDSTVIGGGAVTAELVNGFPGLVSGFQFINIASLVLTGPGPTVLTAYVDTVTPYDYKVNLDAGSIQLNDGSAVALAGLITAVGTAVTAGTAGATTALTVANTAAIGDTVYLSGFTGTNASALNGKTATITAASPTAISVAVNTAALTITFTTGKVTFLNSPVALSAAYSYGGQTLTSALTQPLPNSFLRFEGLNTVETNSPVVVELFKFSNDPLKEMALISDTYGQFQLEGALLSDSLRLTGSKYFSVKQLF